MEGPLDPFNHWPIQLRDDVGRFYLWYIEPNVIVSQMQRAELDLLTTQRFVRRIDAAREAARTEIRGAGGLIAIHDWRSIERVAPAARSFLWAASRKFTPGDIREVHTAVGLSPFARLIVETYNVLISQLVSSPVYLQPDINTPLRRHRIVAPRATARFPGDDDLLQRTA